MNKLIVQVGFAIAFGVASAQDLMLVCEVNTRLDTTGVGVRQEKNKITLRVDTKNGVIDGGIAGTLMRLEKFYPKVSEDKYSAVGSGSVDGSKDLIVPLASYELSRYSGAYKASVTLLAFGKLQQQDEVGQCSQAERKF